jgi:hypothetical protein
MSGADASRGESDDEDAFQRRELARIMRSGSHAQGGALEDDSFDFVLVRVFALHADARADTVLAAACELDVEMRRAGAAWCHANPLLALSEPGWSMVVIIVMVLLTRC